MLHGEFNLGQMLRDANILSVEDLERAIHETRDGESLGQVLHREANWSSLKRLLTTPIPAFGSGKRGRVLQTVLEEAGWISAEQLGLVMDAIDACGDGLGERLVDAALLSPEQLQSARARQETSGAALWRILVNGGYLDVKQIAAGLKIEARILGRLFVERELISDEQMQVYLAAAEASEQSIARLLIEDGVIEAEVVAHAWAELYNVPYCDIADVTPRRELLTHFQSDELTQNLMLPIELRANRLTVALGDPSHIARLKFMWQNSQTRIHAVIAPMTQVLEKIQGIKERAFDDVQQRVNLRDLADINPEALPAEVVDAVLREAFSNRGTDLHFDPGWDQFLVRVRIDGTLHDLITVSPGTGTRIVSRLKALADLDIADHRHPHDGHLSARVGATMADMRIATVPTKYGERVVLRLINSLEVVSDFSGLGLTPDQSETLDELLGNPYGLLLCAGPVGSGKTTTLYCALNKLNVPEKNLITLEDPIEYSLTRVNQIEVAEKQGFTFTDGLRAILRHDPDVMMLGEIRDAESAGVAVRAAMSGVMVMSSIHANESVGAVDTLANLGISPYLIANSLMGAVGQRLARKLCAACSEPYQPKQALLDALGFPDEDATTMEFKRGRGCVECLGTGYRGQTGLFEVMRVTDSMRQLILESPGKQVLREEAVRSGMNTLSRHALGAIQRGLTTPEEFLKNIVV